MIEQIKSKIGQSRTIRDVAEFIIEPTVVMSLDIETFGCNKLPGDSPHYSEHGIAGISISNLSGDALYLVVNDGRNYGGAPIKQAMAALNRLLAEPVVKTVVIHYSKFDQAFLFARGLQVGHLRLIDTWMLRNIKSCGNYVANKLKELVRKKFGISTDTEKEKDDWMAANQTHDYGDVPIEIMSKYACDDPRYSLLALFSEADVTAEDWANHDLYMRNTHHLIQAEARGVHINVKLLRSNLEIATNKLAEGRQALLDNLGGVAVNLDDPTDQEIMAHLHQKNLHSAPWEKFGLLQFSFDRDFLLANQHPLTAAFYKFYRMKTFIKCFSGANGEMGSRIFSDGPGLGGFHTQHLLSLFSRGGIPQLRQPDVAERIHLTNEVRAHFVPRPGHKFVTLRAFDLNLTLLGFYTGDVELQAQVRLNATRPSSTLHYLSERTKQSLPVTGLYLRRLIEGSGFARLEQRFRIAKVKGMGDKKAWYAGADQFEAAFPNLKKMTENLKAEIAANGLVHDRLGRVLKVAADKDYRAHALLLSSSYGSLLSFYLDIFCRLADECGAHLVIANNNEFVFETSIENSQFAQAATEITNQRLIEPCPVWLVQTQTACWSSPIEDAHTITNHEL